MTVLIGVDGGGTKTALLIHDLQGHILVEQVLPGAYLPEVGAAGVEQVLRAICHESEPFMAARPPGYAVFGLAGYGENTTWTETYDTLLKRYFPHVAYQAHNDVRLALEGALEGEPGLVALSGTGSMVVAKTSDGRLHRVGGWGPLLGDEGSAYAVALQALRAAARALDGRGEPTRLLDAAASHYGVDSLAEVIPVVSASGRQRAVLSAFAVAVNSCAQGGDQVARSVLEQAAGALAAQVHVLWHRLGGALPVAWAGGTFESLIFLSAFVDRLTERGVLRCSPARRPPVGGGLILAQKFWQQRTTAP